MDGRFPSLLSDWNLWGKNILELFDLVATTVLVPIGGLLGILLVSCRWGFASAFKELTNGREENYPAGRWYLKLCLKYLAPALIVIIFFSNLNLF